MDDSFDVKNGDSELVTIVAENIRRWRTRHGWSLGDLARNAGVSKSTLSTLETGDGNPGLETLLSVSRALGLAFSELITRHQLGVDVVRVGEAPEVVSAEGNFRGSLLAATGRRGTAELYLFEVLPGDPYTSGGHQQGVIETVVCMSGSIAAGPVNGPVELAEGDRGTFPADAPHVYQALEAGTRITLLLSYPG